MVEIFVGGGVTVMWLQVKEKEKLQKVDKASSECNRLVYTSD